MSLLFTNTATQVVRPPGGSITIGHACSFYAHCEALTQGGGGYGMLFGYGTTGSSEKVALYWSDTTTLNKLRIRAGRPGGTSGHWEMTTEFPTLTGPKACVLTYDGTSNANNPILYTLVDGVVAMLTSGAGLTKASTPTGTIPADPQEFRMGNDKSTNARWHGRIGPFAGWDRVLDPSEARRLLIGGGPLAVLRGLTFWWEAALLVSATALPDLSGQGITGTITSAALAPHFNVRYPVGVGA